MLSPLSYETMVTYTVPPKDALKLRFLFYSSVLSCSVLTSERLGYQVIDLYIDAVSLDSKVCIFEGSFPLYDDTLHIPC